MISVEIPDRLKPFLKQAAAFAGYGSIESYLKFELTNRYGWIALDFTSQITEEKNLKLISRNPSDFWNAVKLASEYFEENTEPDPLMGKDTFLEQVQSITQYTSNNKHGY